MVARSLSSIGDGGNVYGSWDGGPFVFFSDFFNSFKVLLSWIFFDFFFLGGEGGVVSFSSAFRSFLVVLVMMEAGVPTP